MAKRNTYYIDEDVNEDKVDVKNLKRLLRYVIPYKKVVCLLGFLLAVSTAVSLVSPMLIQTVVDRVLPNGDQNLFIAVAIGFIVCAALEIFITFFHSRMMGRVGHSIIAQIRTDVFYKLQELPFEYFDNRPAGKISVRVTEYVNELADFFTEYLMTFIADVLKIVIATVFMLAYSPVLALIVYAVIVPLTGCIFALRYALRKLFRTHRARNSNRSAFIVESIMGEKVIKSYNRTAYNERIYHKLQKDSADTWLSIVKLNALNAPIVEIFWNGGTLLIYGISLALIGAGYASVTTGVVILFVSYMTLCGTPFTDLSVLIQQLAQVSANLERIYETVDYPCSIRNREHPVELKNVRGEICFNDVSFAYEEGINILEHVNLTVKQGETVALVGPTGAGKTTVINLITRFYDVCQGSVTVDGVDVRDAELHSLRTEIGVLMQEPFIFKGTVMDNIRYGKPNATDEECIRAARLIHADRVADRLPNGYFQELEERGEGLSAGEKQLISFARIILRDPAVVILDEATSSIDSETEKLIQDALDFVLKDKTSFIVAHRLSTIRKADRILFIADKGIAEEGSHEELMAKKGLYYQLNQRK